MTYWNPVERYGVDAVRRRPRRAGGAGLITPDLIPDEADEWIAAADAHDLDKVFLVAPSLDRRADRDDHRRLPRLRLRHRGDGRHRRPRPRTSDLAGPLVARTTRRSPTCRSASVSASPTATRRPRSRRTPTA